MHLSERVEAAGAEVTSNEAAGEEKFYMTYSRERPSELIDWIEAHDVPLLTNALHRWSDARDDWLDMWCYDTGHVIDAGGYNVQGERVGLDGSVTDDEESINEELMDPSPFYPWSVKQYHEWLSEFSDEFEWATAMDYACEERFDAVWDVDGRIEATIENTVAHFEYDPDYQVLPVLQGRSVDDYVYTYERLRDQGIPVDHIGLGTVCRLSSTSEIISVEQELRERIDTDTIHGFGVKVDSFKRGATFDTADSAAWVYDPSNGRTSLIERQDGEIQKVVREEQSSSMLRTVESFKSYYTYVSSLLMGEPQAPVEPRLQVSEQYSNDNLDEEQYAAQYI